MSKTKENVIQYQSDKEKTLRDALLNISQSKRFTLISFKDDNVSPVGIISFCDDGEEEKTLNESMVYLYKALELISKNNKI